MRNRHLNKFIVIVTLTLTTVCSASATSGKHLLVFGDSLSAAYGMEIEEGWASLLAQYWQGKGSQHSLTNASISGETTDGGLGRLQQTLKEVKPDVVMIELGANDGLRGHPLPRIRRNLGQLVMLVKQAGAQPILVGISLPPSHGPRYVDSFRLLFPQVAEQYKVPYIDFYREDFFTTPGYIQADGLHPTALPQSIIRDSLLNFFDLHDLF